MGMDAQSAAPAIAAASQAQQGGGAGTPQQQNPMLARLMPLLQQRMQQQGQGQGGGANPAGGLGGQSLPGGPQPPQPGMAGLERPPSSGPIQMDPNAQPMLGGEAQMSTPQQPAWQQLAARGIAGQGSAEANKAKLAELNGGAGAGGSMPFGGGDPMQALRQKIMDVAGAGAMRKDARPGGGMPRGVRAGIPSPGSALPTQVADAVDGATQGYQQTANPPGGGAGGNVRSRGGVRRGPRVNY